MSTNNIGTSTPYILYGGDGKSNISYKFDSAYSSLVTVTTFNVKITKENVNLDSGYVSKVEIVNNGKVKRINLESNGQISKKNTNSAATMTYSIDSTKKTAIISISASESYESSGSITITTQNQKSITGTISSSNSTGNSALVQSGLAFNSTNNLGQFASTGQSVALGSVVSIKALTAQVAVACRSAIRNGTKMSLPEMQTLLDNWQQTRNPRTCPHGRPIYLSLEESALARFFRRNWVIGKSHGI
jgi:hypothetical protein